MIKSEYLIVLFVLSLLLLLLRWARNAYVIVSS